MIHDYDCIYKVEVGQANSLCYVGIVIYDAKTMIGITMLHDLNIYVNPPNFIDRLLGITFGDKIELAVAKQQKLCDRLNEDNRVIREIMMKYNRI